MGASSARHLAAVVVLVAAVDGALAANRYELAAWVGREPLPTFLRGDGADYRATLMSLLDDRDLDVRNQFESLGYTPVSHASLGANGAWYPKHPVLMPVLSLPFFAAAGDPGLLAFNVAQLSVLAALMWALARHAATARAAWAATLAFAFTTMLRDGAYNWSPDVLTAVLTLAAVLAQIARVPIVAGLLWGLSIWSKLPNLFLLIPAAAYSALVFSRRDLIRAGVALALPIAALAFFNDALFGSPWLTSYDRVIASIAGPAVTLEPSHRTFFDVPIAQGLIQQLTDPRNGLLRSAPVLAFAVFGFGALHRRSPREAWLIAGLMAVQILSFAPYRLWNQSNFGHRFLIVTIALGAAPMAALVDVVWPMAREAES